MQCRLCQTTDSKQYFWDQKRKWHYYQCPACDLVFRDPETYLPQLTEKARYETHHNSIENRGYVDFLSPVVESLAPFLSPGAKGLDFGCGPGPILDQLFFRLGFSVKNFDPFFSPHPSFLTQKYDFITCTEAIEHFYQPGQELKLMISLLKKGGYLVLMTELNQGLEKFETWYYRNDDTHVCFLSEATLNWMALNLNLERILDMKRIFIFRKK